MKKNSFIIIVIAICSFFACDDSNEGLSDAWSSGPIEEFSVTPINGGAIVTYTIPNDKNILYVMAEYERNGKIFTEKSSVHNNSLTIEGFHGVSSVQAFLYKVNRNEERSEPIVLEFEPLESLINIAHKSLSMEPNFGGIITSWDNPETTELGVRLMINDSLDTDKLITSEMYFSTLEKEVHAFRGFESKEYKFGIVFEDKWGNVSDTATLVTTPYFETMIDKPFGDLRSTIPYDNTSQQGNLPITMVWDGIVNTAWNGYRTQPGSSGLSFTIDLKQVVKISRIIHHPYHYNSAYLHSAVNEVEVWGTDKLDYDKLSDLPYWLDEFSVIHGAIHSVDPETKLPERTFKDDWEYLGWQSIPRYDLMVPPDPQATRDLAANGWEYDIPVEAKPVRYIRIFVRAALNQFPPSSDNQYSIGELTVYGAPVDSQE